MWVILILKTMDPSLVTEYITAPTIQRYQKGTLILGSTRVFSDPQASA